jgi:hypothetical protein
MIRLGSNKELTLHIQCDRIGFMRRIRNREGVAIALHQPGHDQLARNGKLGIRWKFYWQLAVYVCILKPRSRVESSIQLVKSLRPFQVHGMLWTSDPFI